MCVFPRSSFLFFRMQLSAVSRGGMYISVASRWLITVVSLRHHLRPVCLPPHLPAPSDTSAIFVMNIMATIWTFIPTVMNGEKHAEDTNVPPSSPPPNPDRWWILRHYLPPQNQWRGGLFFLLEPISRPTNWWLYLSDSLPSFGRAMPSALGFFFIIGQLGEFL